MTLESEIRRVATFLEIDAPQAAWPAILRNCSFAEMKAAGKRQDEVSKEMSDVFQGGSQSFFNKGTNGRWREVLSEQELALYEKAATRELSPDCRHWLENGRQGLA
jgi:aryl sulfotransferase